jgi:diadenosine tetraphosphate (Ap4A) HIT family hydrolase/GNAT superfamily N-acetyltransferase
MLIRWATQEDRADWISLASNLADALGAPDLPRHPQFLEYIDVRLAGFEAIAAVERMTGTCLGFIGFSRADNRISWLGVLKEHQGKGIGARLLRCALNQLDRSRVVTAETFWEGSSPGVQARSFLSRFGFAEVDGRVADAFGNPRYRMALARSSAPRGDSFHYRFPRYAAWAVKEQCPVCNPKAKPKSLEVVGELPHSWVLASPEAQGRLFGKCHVVSKAHSVHFYDLQKEEMADFMGDVQRAAQALHRVTGAVRVNYEIHGNTVPHLHVHLFPRYLDDDFPGAPIDHRETHPSPYESDEEYRWFVRKMRGEIGDTGEWGP